MKIYEYLENYFKTSNFELTPYPKGLTNDNYLCTINQQVYVIRVPKQISDHFVDRNIEGYVQELLDQLDFGIPCQHFNPYNGVKITPFIPNLQEFDACDAKTTIAMVAKKLRELHERKLRVHTNFNAIEKLLIFCNHLTNDQLHPAHTQLIKLVETLEYEPVLCHNDLVNGNILVKDHQLFIIDYEYAADNDPYFDIMSFLTENNINDPVLRQIFYENYFTDFSPEIAQHLLIWECFQNLLWYYWADMMYIDTNDTIYDEIRSTKASALTHSLHLLDQNSAYSMIEK